MKTFFTSVCVLTISLFAVFADSVNAQGVIAQGVIAPGQSKDDGEKVKEEVDRRGDMVQPIGAASAGEADYIADALDPPENDSDRWFISVVTYGDEHKNSERLKYDIIHDKLLKSWINVEHPEKSFTHYQCRDVLDTTQEHWFAGIQQYIDTAMKDKSKFPLIVIQPPENGKFGKPEVVAGVISGYDGDVKKLITSVRNKIKIYIKTMLDKKLISINIGANSIRGFAMQAPSAARPPQDFPSPFVQPKQPVDSVQPNSKFEFPPMDEIVNIQPENKQATIVEMKKAKPDAPDQFIMDELMKGVTLQVFIDDYNKHLAGIKAIAEQEERNKQANFQSAFNQMGHWLNAILTMIVGTIIGIILRKFHLQQTAMVNLINRFDTTTNSNQKS